MENQGNEEQENIPMELTGPAPAAVPAPVPVPNVASVAVATMAVMPEPGTEKRKIKPKTGVSVKTKPSASRIAQLKKELNDGSKRLKPEELNNPFSKEFNKLFLKKELLEREMTLYDIGKLPDSSDDEAASAATAALDGLYPTLNDPNFNTKIALRKEFFDTKMDVDNTKSVESQAEILCNAQIELAPNQQFVRNFLSVETERRVPQSVSRKRCVTI